MFGKPFYHQSLRKIIASFGAVFSNIMIVRKLGENEVEKLHVPLSYGPAERFLVRLNSDPNLTRAYNIKLPRMAFEISSVNYDSTRKLNTIKKQIASKEGENANVLHNYQGVPYNIGISLSIISKYIDEANQIFEQIVPWFTPSFTITINSIPELNYKDDVPIILQGVNLEDSYSEDWASRRQVIWNMSFSLKAMFYGPITNRPLVTKVIEDIYASSLSEDLDDPMRRQLIPRAFRRTTEINPLDANFDDDFGYTETIQAFSDYKVRDPETGVDVEIKHRIGLDPIPSTSKVYKPTIK